MMLSQRVTRLVVPKPVPQPKPFPDGEPEPLPDPEPIPDPLPEPEPVPEREPVPAPLMVVEKTDSRADLVHTGTACST